MKKQARRCALGARRFIDSVKVVLVPALIAVGGCADVDIHAPDWGWEGDFAGVGNTAHAAEAPFRHDLGTAATLSLSGVAGSVVVGGSPSAQGIVVEGMLRVRSYSKSDAQAHLADVDVEVWAANGTAFVQTRQPQTTRGRKYEVEYRVAVPLGTNVTISQVAGPVQVYSVTGNVETDVSAGSIELTDLQGDVRAWVAAGGVDASVSLPRNGLVELQSGAGEIRLRVPQETSASILAATSAGTVHVVDLALADEDPRASVLRATMASGDGTIRLETGAGNITIRAR